MACCSLGQGPSRRSRVSHSQRVVCVSSSGFHVCAMGRARLGPPRQGHEGRSPGSNLQVPTKPDAPCSFAALRRGPGSVSWMVAAVWARCCAPGHQHSQPAERQELFSRPGTWDRPPQQDRCRGLCWGLEARCGDASGAGPQPRLLLLRGQGWRPCLQLHKEAQRSPHLACSPGWPVES